MSANPAPAACGPAAIAPAATGADLVRRAQLGDVSAYELLVRRHELHARRLARTITRDAGDAEDATQEAFLKAYRSLGRFRPHAPFKPWFLKIVANEARSRRRARARAAAITARATAEQDERTLELALDGEAVAAEHRQLLLDAVGRLPPKFREVVTCRYVLDLSERETASALGIRPGTVKSRLARALERLEYELGRAGAR